MSKLHKNIAHVPLKFVGYTKETIWMTNGDKDIRIKKDNELKINDLLKNGYYFGRICRGNNGKIKNRIWITNGINSYIINKDKLNDFLNNGFVIGRKFKK